MANAMQHTQNVYSVCVRVCNWGSHQSERILQCTQLEFIQNGHSSRTRNHMTPGHAILWLDCKVAAQQDNLHAWIQALEKYIEHIKGRLMKISGKQNLAESHFQKRMSCQFFLLQERICNTALFHKLTARLSPSSPTAQKSYGTSAITVPALTVT